MQKKSQNFYFPCPSFCLLRQTPNLKHLIQKRKMSRPKITPNPSRWYPSRLQKGLKKQIMLNGQQLWGPTEHICISIEGFSHKLLYITRFTNLLKLSHSHVCHCSVRFARDVSQTSMIESATESETLVDHYNNHIDWLRKRGIVLAISLWRMKTKIKGASLSFRKVLITVSQPHIQQVQC